MREGWRRGVGRRRHQAIIRVGDTGFWNGVLLCLNLIVILGRSAGAC